MSSFMGKSNLESSFSIESGKTCTMKEFLRINLSNTFLMTCLINMKGFRAIIKSRLVLKPIDTFWMRYMKILSNWKQISIKIMSLKSFSTLKTSLAKSCIRIWLVNISRKTSILGNRLWVINLMNKT